MTLNIFMYRHEVIYKRRKLAPNTYKPRKNQFEIIRSKSGEMILNKITMRQAAMFLENWIESGKHTQAGKMRSVLSDIFREAIVEGHISHNPVTPT